MAVFASWFDVSCLVAGAGRDRGRIADGLARLAEHSLLVVERGSPTRYRSLETIRQFGLEQLDQAGELKQARDSHERWCRLVVDELRRVETADIDETWCDRFDRVVDDVAAALTWCATDEGRREEAASLAGELAGLLFLRGRPAQAQRRYEQAADLAATGSERAAYLRLAAGSAASRYVGDEALRLFGMAADVAVSIGDRSEAVQDLATMAMYINRAPGIMATLHSRTEADVLLAKARTLSDRSPLAEAALAVAEFADVPAVADSRRVVELTERAGDGVLHSIALDLLTLAHLVDNDVAGAVRVVHSRLELLSTLPVGPLSGFELGDGQLMAAEVDMDAGDLTGAAAHAEALARLPFYRDEDHVAMSRRILVDALAGHFDDVVRTGERFRIAWERAGRPVAPNLARTSYAVAMVYGMRGDDDRRATWVRVTHDLGVDADGLAGYQRGWAATFDALLALHRNDPTAAVRRLGTDSTTLGCFGPSAAGSGCPGMRHCGRRPPCSTTTPMRHPASSGAGALFATTRSRQPSSIAPPRSMPASTATLTVSRSRLPSWVARTSRNEPPSCRYVRMNEGQSPHSCGRNDVEGVRSVRSAGRAAPRAPAWTRCGSLGCRACRRCSRRTSPPPAA